MESGRELAVLYVDDELSNLEDFQAVFGDRFSVLVATSGGAALELLAARASDVGVLLTDQRMPGMSGADLAEKVAQLYPDIVRMVLTGYSDTTTALESINRGQVSRFFIKPWNRVELGAALEEALRMRALQAKVRAFEVQLLASSGLLTVGQMSAGLAHELMNPIGYISQNLASLRREFELLKRYLEPHLPTAPGEVKSAVEDLPPLLADLETGVGHIRSVSGRVKDTVRGPSCDQEETTEVHSVASFVVRMARSESGALLQLSVQGPNVQVRCGTVRLTQVLLNLVLNAVHAVEQMPHPGQVELSWGVDRSPTSASVFITVRDNGCGIAPELQEKVFEPMYTTRGTAGGTGLGLGLCRQLLREVSGDLTFVSTPGEGSAFTVRLPLAPQR